MLESSLILFVVIVALALIFDYINGFHDAANAIATVVSTKVMSPRVAVIFGAGLNFAGALMGTEVAATIGKGLVDQGAVTLKVVLAALISGIIWNLFTWFKGLPTSSSHALIGSLIGATVFASKDGLSHVHIRSFINKVLIPMILSPIGGVVVGVFFMVILTWIVFRMNNMTLKKVFGKLQIVSAGLMALSHGHNDAQKAMGIIALALVVVFPKHGFEVPFWVIASCATAMGLGTLGGGWRIIRTLGSKMAKLQPIHGFAAETSSAIIIMACSQFGIPVSTTQVISSSIMGVGATKRLSAVRWTAVGSIVMAWMFTLPATFCLAGFISFIFTKF